MNMRLFFAATLVGAVLFCGGCELLEEKKREEVDVEDLVFDGIKDGSTYAYLYIDLDDPDSPASAGTGTEWDIVISGQREIFTNSGNTAAVLGSGGSGGAVFSGETDIDADLDENDAEDAFEEDARDGVDYPYWDKSKTSSATPTEARTGNAICFPGYKTQDGRDGLGAATAWIFGEEGAHVDVDFSLGTAYASWERMDPKFSDYTNNVYFIRSGDGKKFYKLQIPEVVYTSATSSSDGKTHYTFSVRCAELP